VPQQTAFQRRIELGVLGDITSSADISDGVNSFTTGYLHKVNKKSQNKNKIW
jgi:hypothetical protein